MFLPPKSFLLPSLLIAIVLGIAGCSPQDSSQQASTSDTPTEAATTVSDQGTKVTSPETPSTEEEDSNSTDSQPAANDSVATTEKPSDASNSENMLAAADSTKPVVTQSTTPKPKPGKTIDMTFDDIKFDIEPDADFERSMLPQAIEDLKKQKIRIGGFILPGFQSRDIKQFVLVRDNMECCFGPGAALYDCIMVEMTGRSVDFTVRPVTVEGEFTIQEYKDGDGKVRAIYHLQGTNVR